MELLPQSDDLWNRPRKELIQLLYAYRTAIDENLISSITDSRGKIIYANKKFCEVSKWAPWELIGQSHRIINSGYHEKAFFRNLWEQISSGEMWRGEIKNKAKDGTLYWVDTVIIPILDDKNKPYQYVSLRQVINDRKILEASKQQYTDSLASILAQMSHNMRKPIASCLGLMEIVEKKELAQEELKKTIEYFKHTALELDTYSKELSLFIANAEKKLQEDILGKVVQ